MKKLVSLLLVFVAIFAFTSCAGGPGAPMSEEDFTRTLGIITKNMTEMTAELSSAESIAALDKYEAVTIGEGGGLKATISIDRTKITTKLEYDGHYTSVIVDGTAGKTEVFFDGKPYGPENKAAYDALMAEVDKLEQRPFEMERASSTMSMKSENFDFFMSVEMTEKKGEFVFKNTEKGENFDVVIKVENQNGEAVMTDVKLNGKKLSDEQAKQVSVFFIGMIE